MHLDIASVLPTWDATVVEIRADLERAAYPLMLPPVLELFRAALNLRTISVSIGRFVWNWGVVEEAEREEGRRVLKCEVKFYEYDVDVCQRTEEAWGFRLDELV